MQMIYMIVGREILYLYEKYEEKYRRQYIFGNPEFHYQINEAKKDIEKMMDALADEYNLENRSDLSFFVLTNGNESITQTVCEALEGYIAKKIDLDGFMSEIIKKISMDKKKLVKEYGVNYDGMNYCLTDGKLRKNDYKLLGYTLWPDDLLNYIG